MDYSPVMSIDPGRILQWVTCQQWPFLLSDCCNGLLCSIPVSQKKEQDLAMDYLPVIAIATVRFVDYGQYNPPLPKKTSLATAMDYLPATANGSNCHLNKYNSNSKLI